MYDVDSEANQRGQGKERGCTDTTACGGIISGIYSVFEDVQSVKVLSKSVEAAGGVNIERQTWERGLAGD